MISKVCVMNNEENSGYFDFGIIPPCQKPMECNNENPVLKRMEYIDETSQRT